MHTALALDVWQKSAHRDRDAEHAAGESSDPRAAVAAPTTFCRADYDGTESSATGADGRNVMAEPLSVRRDLLQRHILPKLGEPVRHCPELNASLADVIESVRAAGLEGVVAKRLDSIYEPGSRSGAWRKMRINQAQEFVIGGYTLGGKNFDALIFGGYEGGRLLYVGRTRAASRRHCGSNFSGDSAGWRSQSAHS